jgi:Kyakuja-Dileera-Zisupton transposase
VLGSELGGNGSELDLELNGNRWSPYRCHIEITLDNSPLGPLAHSLNYKSLVDVFHGHAHRRLCQLSHLTTYTCGLGLEDLGVCERAFSRSNGLGGAMRYMGVFHRMQAIARYFEDTGHLETYQNLSKKPCVYSSSF